MKRTLFIALLLIIACSCFSQTPAVMWYKTYGGLAGDYGNSVWPTSDGGFIMTGYAGGWGGDVTGYHGNASIGDYWVIKVDGNGKLQWQKAIGTTYTEQASQVRQTPDGGYVVFGYASPAPGCAIAGDKGALDFWLVKLNASGDTLWNKFYGGSKHEYGYGLDLTADGGFLLTGFTESNDGDVTGQHGNRDVWVVKTDGAGNLQWQKTLGGSAGDEGIAIKATADGGCVVAGHTASVDDDVTGNHGNMDSWIIKLGATGNIEWKKCYGGTRREEAWSVQTTTDGGYIAAGYTESNDGDVSGNHGASDYWVTKLDATGNLQWQKCYGGFRNDQARYIQNTSDGGYVVAGQAESNDGDVSCNAGVTDFWMVKLNSSGTLQWQKSIGGSSYDDALCIQPLNDGGFIVGGTTCSPDVKGYITSTISNGTCGDFFLTRLSAPIGVAPAPAVTIQPPPGKLCAGISATFTAYPQYAGINPTIRWERNGVTVGTNSLTYTASDLQNNDILKCYVTAGGGCSTPGATANTSITLQVSSSFLQPQIDLTSNSTVICNCTPVVFTANVTNGGSLPVFKWYVNAVNTGEDGATFTTANLQSGDRVSFVYTDTSACIVNGADTSNIITIGVSSGQAPGVGLSISPMPSCNGQAVTFTANPVNAGSNPVYEWKLNGVTVGGNSRTWTSSTLTTGDNVSITLTPDPTYPCITSINPVSNNVVVQVRTPVTPTVSIAASVSNFCKGTPVTFTANANNAGTNPSYQWQVNGIYTGGNSKQYTSSTLVNGDVVLCVLTTDPNFACVSSTRVNSNPLTQQVIDQAAPTVTISNMPAEVCEGKNMRFTAVYADAGNNPSFQWSVNNTIVNNNTAIFNSASLKQGDAVRVVMTPGTGSCITAPVSSNSIPAVVHASPLVTITPADTVVNTGTQASLRAFATNIASYVWSPVNKLSNANGLQVLTQPLMENTVYSIAVTDDKGCAASANAVVKVSLPFTMPDAFTPNGDGKNEVFRIPPAVLIQLQEFSIFDRWGNRVFTTQDSSKGWDGTIGGQPASTGTYVYIIRGSNVKGNVAAKGHVTLLR